MPTTLLSSASLRPRERLLSYGVEALSLEEVLAVILGSGSGGHPVHSLARQLSRVLLNGCEEVERISQIPGIGRAKALEVVAALGLAAKVEQCRGLQSFDQPERVYEAMADLLPQRQEHLAVFYLTVRNRLLQREVVSVGTLASSLVHAREVFRPAILHSAMHVIVAHNHPSGCCQPSQADFMATQYLARAGRMLGIELLDHVVCAADGFVSLRDAHPELFIAR